MTSEPDEIRAWINSRTDDLSRLPASKLARELLDGDDFINLLDMRIAPFKSTEKRRLVESAIGLSTAMAGLLIGGPIGFASGLGVTAAIEMAHMLDKAHCRDHINLKQEIIEYKIRLKSELRDRLSDQ